MHRARSASASGITLLARTHRVVARWRRRLIGPVALSRPRQLGQGIVELAIVLPLFLTVTLVIFDFGRALQAWVSLQQMARIGANFASNHPTAWNAPGLPGARSEYQDLVRMDLDGLGCTLPSRVPDPVFGAGIQIGSPVAVTVSCSFSILTPLVAGMLPSPFNISARAIFPIRAGAAMGNQAGGSVPGAAFSAVPATGLSPLTVDFADGNTTGTKPSAWCWNFGDSTSTPTCDATTKTTAHTYLCGSGTCIFSARLRTTNIHGSSEWSEPVTITVTAPPPAAPSFTTTPSPASGPPPLLVQFSDTSTGGPTSWCWNFGDGSAWPACDTTLRNPSHQFASLGTYTVRMCAYNAGGPSAPCPSPATATVTVGYSTPPPVASFTFFPSAGTYPLTVAFTDTSTNSPASWSWQFGAGQGTSSVRDPSWTYTAAGTYTITLIATNAAGSNTTTRQITITAPLCSTPSFVGLKVNTSADLAYIAGLWSSRGFTGLLSYSPSLPASGAGSGKHDVTAQSISGVQLCSSSITLTRT